jgi:tetratricopeptide (TPR) repeat protein/GTPase SAR1 family protein
MTEQRRFPYGSVPVYNPQSLSKTEALAQFHARQAAYLGLMDLLREERPSHVLIIGTRGMGKTTLLQRLRYGVEEDAELNSRYLVLAYPEEQYNVNRLHRFLLNTVDALADAMERLKNERMLKHVEEYAEVVGKCTSEEIEERVPQFLAEIGQQMQKSFLLLVDNADRLFEVIEDRQQWRLRELLSSRHDLTFFGATTQASDGIYGPDRAFFEFFQIHQLAPLTFAEVRDLLLRLSESVEEKEGEKGSAKQRVAEWLDADAARLRTLVQLTGGNPRTTVLLFHLVLDGLAGGAREYLEQLLDQVTPTYKGRVDELPPQAQQVLDAVAIRWDPVIAAEVAEDTGLETSAVSAQLTRLVRQGILEKADAGDSKKALYQVAERFFNIWYLMRASRRVRAKLRWFVEFLRVFFDSGELEQMAWERLERFRRARGLRPNEIENIFAYALASGKDPNTFEDYLRRECADREEEWQPFLALARSPEGDALDGWKTPNVCIRSGLETKGQGIGEINALRAAVQVEPGNAEHWSRLGHALASSREFACEAEEALRKAIDLKPDYAPAWAKLGNLLGKVPERLAEAEDALRKAIGFDTNTARAWADLGGVLTALSERPERRQEGEAALRRALGLDPNYAWAWGKLGDFLRQVPNALDEAEMALRKAVELDPNYTWAWGRLGELLRQMPNALDEAEMALRKAIELDPNHAFAWASLGELLRQRPNCLKEAETSLRKATEIKPDYAWAWGRLGELLGQMPERRNEGEASLREAIKLNPKVAWPWCALGSFLAEIPVRWTEAQTALNKALEIDPSDGNVWGQLGFLLACRAGRPQDAEVAFRNSVRLAPDNARDIRNLGVLLYCELAAPEEAEVYLGRAHQLSVGDHVSTAILAAALRGSETVHEQPRISIDVAREAGFWDELLGLCQNYAPFGKILLGICDLVQERDNSNRFVRLYRAVALAQLGDFPRASVALEDALTGDPIDLLSMGQRALETFLAAAVRSGRVRDCIELIDKKEWKDAWRPIYEALRAVEAGSAEYLKRIAVEIRVPALVILRRIAPQVRDLPERNG